MIIQGHCVEATDFYPLACAHDCMCTCARVCFFSLPSRAHTHTLFSIPRRMCAPWLNTLHTRECYGSAHPARRWSPTSRPISTSPFHPVQHSRDLGIPLSLRLGRYFFDEQRVPLRSRDEEFSDCTLVTFRYGVRFNSWVETYFNLLRNVV